MLGLPSKRVECRAFDHIKGRGGALRREKILANASDRMIVVDETKLVDRLAAIGCAPGLRRDG